MTLVLILAMSLSGILNQAVTAEAWEEKECNVTIIYHGKTTRATSYGETAAQLLDRLGLEVSGEDVVSHGMDTPPAARYGAADRPGGDPGRDLHR